MLSLFSEQLQSDTGICTCLILTKKTLVFEVFKFWIKKPRIHKDVEASKFHFFILADRSSLVSLFCTSLYGIIRINSVHKSFEISGPENRLGANVTDNTAVSPAVLSCIHGLGMNQQWFYISDSTVNPFKQPSCPSLIFIGMDTMLKTIWERGLNPGFSLNHINTLIRLFSKRQIQLLSMFL